MLNHYTWARALELKSRSCAAVAESASLAKALHSESATRRWMTEAAMVRGFSSGDTATPLLTAVTGHREVAGEGAARVAEQVRQALIDIRALVPHTSIRIASGLADGADRIVARAALDLGMAVEVVVPAPIERYRRGSRLPRATASTPSCACPRCP